MCQDVEHLEDVQIELCGAHCLGHPQVMFHIVPSRSKLVSLVKGLSSLIGLLLMKIDDAQIVPRLRIVLVDSRSLTEVNGCRSVFAASLLVGRNVAVEARGGKGQAVAQKVEGNTLVSQRDIILLQF